VREFGRKATENGATSHERHANVSPNLARWSEFEASYRRGSYAGNGEPASSRLVGNLQGGVLFTAPHAVNHFRNGRQKLAEIGTGGLAEVLAAEMAAAALTADGSSATDANWDDEAQSLFKQRIRSVLQPELLVLDLHGMRDDYGIDVSIGRGPGPTARSLAVCDRLVKTLTAMGLSSAIDRPFDAKRAGTVVSFVQEQGGAALQLEIARRLRRPEEEPEAASRLLSALAMALR
jgi:hypothetical protein